MLVLLLLIILVFAGIFPGVYLSLKHILGWKFLQGKTLRHLERGGIPVFLLRAGLFGFFSSFTLTELPIGLVTSFLFALLNVFIINWLGLRQWGKKSYRQVLLSGIVAGGVVGGLWFGFILFYTASALDHTMIIVFTSVLSVLSGAIEGGLTNGVTMLLLFMGGHLSRFTFRVLAPLFIIPRFAAIICNHCYRMTFPLKCRYELGRRSCEHCQQAVEDTKEVGNVIFTFGNISFSRGGRVFVLSNPDFEHKEHHVEVSEVYIDPPTTDKRLLERFITYIVNYPPEKGLQAVQICYQGELDALGDHLKNALQNTFTQIEKIS